MFPQTFILSYRHFRIEGKPPSFPSKWWISLGGDYPARGGFVTRRIGKPKTSEVSKTSEVCAARDKFG